MGIEYFVTMGKINTKAVGALVSIALGFLFLVIGVATKGWTSTTVKRQSTLFLESFNFNSGLADYKGHTEGEAAYALLIIAILSSVVSLCSMAAHVAMDFMDKMNEIVAVMPKVAFVSALVGGVFAIIGIIVFAATFYTGYVGVNYSLFLTIVGAISLLGGGVSAFKFDKGTQVAA